MKRVLLISLLMLMSLATIALAADKPTAEQERLASSIVGSYNAGDNAGIAASMLYAPGDNTAERARMERAMRVFTAIFGTIKSYAPPTANYEYLPVTAAPKGQPSTDSARVVYNVEFERLGKGMVIIGIATIDGRDTLTSISFALPPDRQDAQAILSRIHRNIE